MLAKTGARPKIFLANLGTIAEFTARASVAKTFFEAGGIEARSNDGFPNREAMIAPSKRRAQSSPASAQQTRFMTRRHRRRQGAGPGRRDTIYLADGRRTPMRSRPPASEPSSSRAATHWRR
jgi:hypothetical protein